MDGSRKRALGAGKMAALRDGIPVDTMYQGIAHAIKKGFENPDPKAHEIWRMIPSMLRYHANPGRCHHVCGVYSILEECKWAKT